MYFPIMATSTAITGIIGSPRILTGCSKRIRKWSVNVWPGILGDYIIGPHFFDGKINGEKYRKFLENNLVNLLEEVLLESCINRFQ